MCAGREGGQRSGENSVLAVLVLLFLNAESDVGKNDCCVAAELESDLILTEI